jgi:hypothetical protein
MKSISSGIIGRAARRLMPARKPRPFDQFIGFTETLAAAKAAGVSVSDYIERRHMVGPKTALELTMDGLTSLGVFNQPIERICELGPGSGRYLEKVRVRANPQTYEIYETSTEWRAWLVEQYRVQARTCDGKTLAETESGSVGLVHAHKLFPGLPDLATINYLREMARVVGENGWIVFDVMTEACFSEPYLDAWLNVDHANWNWTPHLMPRNYAVDLFSSRGIHFTGSFLIPLWPGVTECMVFRKSAPVSG